MERSLRSQGWFESEKQQSIVLAQIREEGGNDGTWKSKASDRLSIFSVEGQTAPSKDSKVVTVGIISRREGCQMESDGVICEY